MTEVNHYYWGQWWTASESEMKMICKELDDGVGVIIIGPTGAQLIWSFNKLSWEEIDRFSEQQKKERGQ